MIGRVVRRCSSGGLVRKESENNNKRRSLSEVPYGMICGVFSSAALNRGRDLAGRAASARGGGIAWRERSQQQRESYIIVAGRTRRKARTVEKDGKWKKGA